MAGTTKTPVLHVFATEVEWVVAASVEDAIAWAIKEWGPDEHGQGYSEPDYWDQLPDAAPDLRRRVLYFQDDQAMQRVGPRQRQGLPLLDGVLTMGLLVTLSPRLVDSADRLEHAEARMLEANNRRMRAARAVIEASAGCDREIRTLQFETEAAQRAEQDFLVAARQFTVEWRSEKAAHERAESKAQAETARG